MLAFLISFLTFPGVIFHELGHKKFCDFFGVRVFKVSYFRLGNPIGLVVHEQPTKYRQVFWISMGPLILNSLVGTLASFLAFYGNIDPYWKLFFLWISLSAGFHAFPSDHDMDNIVIASKTPLHFADFIKLSFIFRYTSLLFVYPMRWVNNQRWLWLVYAFVPLLLGFLLSKNLDISTLAKSIGVLLLDLSPYK